MHAFIIASAVSAATGVVDTSPALHFHADADVVFAEAGDTINWTVTAEMSGVGFDYAGLIDVAFTLSHLDAGVTVTSGSFTTDFQGPLGHNNGIIAGDTISAAAGAQGTPLFFATPNATNPIAVYTFSTLVNDGTNRTLATEITPDGQITYGLNSVLPPFFFDIAFARDFLGTDLIPITTTSDKVQVIPAPASAALMALGGFAAARRRRA